MPGDLEHTGYHSLTGIRIAWIIPVVMATLRGYSQADFSVPDTICIDQEVIMENLSRDAETYYWNFCSGNLIYDPEGENLPNPEP